jgi:hypothetical protein
MGAANSNAAMRRERCAMQHRQWDGQQLPDFAREVLFASLDVCGFQSGEGVVRRRAGCA